ncbi:hypothetical protein ABZ330_03955 [Streptomyces sp. NPDC006172]|uniref:hypothetical protein n=1 Tax=Streptomyces sp. NPDC006172 TaxID=3154470 RepID=UPI0033C06EC2
MKFLEHVPASLCEPETPDGIDEVDVPKLNRDAVRHQCARHPILAGLVAGALCTFAFWVFLPVGIGDAVLIFTAVAALFTLTALSERRRRRRAGLAL